MPVPFAFSAATSAIPLSQLDTNFDTTITLGNTAIQLGNTVTTLNNMTLANVTISSGNVTITNVTVTTANVTTVNATTVIATTANVTTANVATSIVTGSETLSYGTVNGVAYLNGSKVLTTGSALTFDGTNLGIGVAGSAPLSFANATGQKIRFYNALTGYGIGVESSEFRFVTDNSAVFTWGIGSYASPSELMRLNSSGNLGLGVTPSAWSGFPAIQVGQRGAVWSSTGSGSTFLSNNTYYNGGFKYIQTGVATQYEQGTGLHAWFTAASGIADTAITFIQAMTLDASGNLLVGNTSGNVGSYGKAISLAATASAYAGLEISGTTGGALEFQTSQSTRQVQLLGNSSGFIVNVNGGSGLAERARITSGGYFKASDAGTYANSTGSYHELRQTANASSLLITSTSGSLTANVLEIYPSRDTSNGTFNLIAAGINQVGNRFVVADSGNVTNTNGSYGTISDQKMKTDIVDAGSQWSDIKALRFRKFKMKDDPSGLVQLGVVAQEVELTSPGLVDEHQDRDAEGNDLGTTTKSVKTSVLLMKAAVALQEAMSRIETLEAEVAALKGA